MMEGTDISKIIGIIMENPDIVNQIRSLAENSQKEDNSIKTGAEATIETEAPASEEKDTEAAFEKNNEKKDIESPNIYEKKRRRELLCALKPYVSKERTKAIDTMLSVIEVWEVLKVRDK